MVDDVQDNEQTRVLVTGAAGMLGSQVILAVPDGIEVVGTDLRAAPGVEAVGTDLADAAPSRPSSPSTGLSPA